MKILIVKNGALGDVVRTSYFAGSLRRKYGDKLELCWLTAPAARILLAANPYINRLSTSFDDFLNDEFDIVYSLDDEMPIVAAVAKLRSKRVIGAVLDKGNLTYTPDAAEWFDMGLLSKFGKNVADELKKTNIYGHAEIFQRIFEVCDARPEFFLTYEGKVAAEMFMPGSGPLVGINPYAGGRWPSKEIRDQELFLLVRAICEGRVFSVPVTVVLFGAADDRLRNETLFNLINAKSFRQKIVVADTDASLMTLAGYISRLSYMISSDSLAMHLSIAQNIPTLAFFAPTSAAEIDNFGICKKLVSLSSDYCSYAKTCDNSSITANRIIELIYSSDIKFK
jgi:heptosyltransferase-2